MSAIVHVVVAGEVGGAERMLVDLAGREIGAQEEREQVAARRYPQPQPQEGEVLVTGAATAAGSGSGRPARRKPSASGADDTHPAAKSTAGSTSRRECQIVRIIEVTSLRGPGG